jgi:hypothetical protein
MDSARAQYVVDRVDAEGYEPDVIDGAQVGEFHQIEPASPAACSSFVLSAVSTLTAGTRRPHLPASSGGTIRAG